MIFALRVTLVAAVILQLFEAGVPLSGQVFVQTCPAPQFPGRNTGIDSQCGVAGTGLEADAIQDKTKNNFCAPGPAQAISFDDMLNLQNAVEKNKAINFGNPLGEHPLTTLPGATTDRTPLVGLGEGGLRVIEGYILIARQEGKESVNCSAKVPNQPAFHDIHISLVADEPSIHGDECESVVAEMSPHHRPTAWTAADVLWVASKHARVRATGQLFFDSSHTPCVGGSRVESDPARFSLWEIHPIYKFEVCDGSDCSTPKNWLSLEDWLKKHPNTHQPRQRQQHRS
jgi:hypothetical protein